MFIHYHVFTECGKLIADGEGTKGRFKSIEDSCNGIIPGTKHMKSLPLYLQSKNNNIGEIQITEYDTKEEVREAEKISHLLNGRPKCKEMIRESLTERTKYLGYDMTSIKKEFPFMKMVFVFLIGNGDNFTKSMMNDIIEELDSNELKFFNKFFNL